MESVLTRFVTQFRNKLSYKGVGGILKRSNDICCISMQKNTTNYGSSLGMLFGVALLVIAESSSSKYQCKQTTDDTTNIHNANNPNPAEKNAPSNSSAKGLQDDEELSVEEELAALEKSVERNPRNGAMKIQLILKYLRLDKLDAAEKFLKKVVDSNPMNYLFHFYLGMVFARKGNDSAAEKHLRKSISINNQYSDSYLMLSSLLQHSGKIEDAKQILKSAIITNKKETKLYISLAELVSSEESIAILREGIQNTSGHDNHKDALLLNKLARAQLDINDLPSATQTLQESLEKDDKIYMTRVYLAVMAEKSNNTSEAVEYLKAAIKLDPKSSVAYKNLAHILYNSQQYTKSVQVCKEYQQRNIRDGPSKNAKNDQQDIDMLAEEEIWSVGHMALCKIAQKEYVEAENLLQRAILLEPNSNDNLIYLGYVREHLNKYTSALIPIEQAIKLNPMDSQAYQIQAKCYLHLRDYPQALVSSQIQLQLDPNAKDAVRRIGDCQYHLKQFQDAIFSYQTCLLEEEENNQEQSKPDPALLAKIAASYFALKQYEQAGKYFKKAIQLQPSIFITYLPQIVVSFKHVVSD